MMEILTILKDKNDLNNINNGIIVGLKNFSTNYNVSLSVDEINNISKDRDVFVAVNKIIFNDEIEDLKEKLINLSKTKIKGVLFYDLCIIQINNELKLGLNLIWNQTHMVTNYNTCNFYYKNGVVGCMLSNELTIDEMIEIKRKTKMKVIANVIFKPVMSHSRRSLLRNYFKTINKEKEDRDYEIFENVANTKYIVKEDDTGTTFIYGNIINGIEPLFKMIEENFDYVVVDKTYLENNEYDFAINLIYDIINKNLEIEDAINESIKVFGNDTGFFYKKTIYKVK